MSKQNKVLLSIVVFSTISLSIFSYAESFHSKYKGQHTRKIKSLSSADVAELRKGGGWGLAKAAELNGFPGPAHVLEMAKEINLSSQQTFEIKKLFKTMNAEAIVLGEALIALETELDNSFSESTINEKELSRLVNEIANVKAKLRLSHLSTHLKTPEILTNKQVELYNQLRGYDNKNPCDAVPAGHNPEMWKKHNGCS